MGRGGGISATARLRQDYIRLKKDPLPYIVAEPLPSNLLEWHYVVTGPENSPYQGGLYHGKLVFPIEFPFKPPSIYMITPNGRFITQQRLCLSISDFHPDMWNPSWTLGSILNGLLSFMLESSPTTGSIETPVATKRNYAYNSLEFNLSNKTFVKLFPDLVDHSKNELKKRMDSASSNPNPLESCIKTSSQSQESFFDSILTHFIAIGCFAAFALIVKHVLQTISSSDGS
ncbi:ubiquitin-conjugating enzyme E2 J2 [Lepeophtheirus salmonis]|uniref:Ubiquitin-conjugating enzyme E2 J2 n=2 Tax=Lepeophtheirus salmonis TaxID=72036 RepID=C1BT57_LEPSM|nr:ubiquitin-conjugating enzyme E2 J2-like [Lepeophtheirus salmonis]ACO12210.1 Ubiquitin-conjugating enzyme E2 J2 [Lepeophtheirus salmonis]